MRFGNAPPGGGGVVDVDLPVAGDGFDFGRE